MNKEDLTFVRGVVYSNRTVIKNVIMPRTAHKVRCLQVQQRNEFGLIQVEKEFSTGIADIDAQHKIFMKYINLCHDAVTRDRLHGVPPELVKKSSRNMPKSISAMRSR